MWEEVELEGSTIWNSDSGTVFKTPEGSYVAGVPRVVKLGPFASVEEAQQAAEDADGGLDRALEQYNLNLVNLVDELRGK